MKITRNIRYKLEVLLIALLVLFFRLLGLKISRFFWKHFTCFLGKKLPVNKVVKRNIAICSPNLSTLEKQKLEKKAWQNFGILIAEFPFLNKIYNNFDKYCEISSREKYADALKKYGKVVLCSAHISNWEFLLPIANRLESKPVAFYRPINNRHLDNWIKKTRKNFVLDYVPKGISAARKLVELMKSQNNAISILVDQRDSKGIEVEFFGNKVFASQIFADIAIRYKLPIIFFTIYRDENGYYHSEPKLIIYPEENKTAAQITQLVYKELEEYIKKYPDQWFWMHKRFERWQYSK